MKQRIAKYLLMFFVIVAFAGFFSQGKVIASEVDILVQKLVEKGILTAGDAQQIITETKEEARLQLAQGKSLSAPSWVQKIKVSGDLRNRYQWEQKKDAAGEKYAKGNRDRLRFRIGVDAEVNDKVTVGAGLATGSEDPRSTNQTLYDAFQTPDIRLDYAYGEYKPLDWLSMVMGKFKRKSYLWEPSDLLWDGDIRPNGAAMHLSAKPYSGVEIFGNAFYGIIGPSSSSIKETYPGMYALQPGIKWNILADNPKKAYLKAVGTYYIFNGLDNVAVGAFSGSAGTNTAAASEDGPLTGNYKYNYDSFCASGEIGLNEPLGEISLPYIGIPYLGLFGEYIHNPDPDSNNTGWIIGAKIGTAKVKKPGQWQIACNYRELEKDAWVDFLSDSDFYSGDTNAKGSELIFKYGLLDNLTFGLDWYHTRPITGTSTKRKQDVVQCDLLLKF